MRTLHLLLAVSLAACGPSAAAQHAQTLLDSGDYRSASTYAEGELVKHPDDAQLHRIRLRALLGLGDAPAAIADYRAWYRQRGSKDDGAALRTLAMTTIWQALTSPSVQLKVAAIRAVERLELEPLAQDVGRAMGDDNDLVAAAAAVAVLRAFPQAPEVADQMLRSDDPAARAIAVEGIGRKARGFAADDLRPALSDPDPRVRAIAATTIGGFGDGRDTAKLLELTVDVSAEVRAAALRGLASGSRGRQPQLGTRARAALADESLGVRLAAVALIARVDGKDALRTLFADADPMVAITAAKGVGDRAAAVAVFDRALASNQIGVRAGAVNLLASALDRASATGRATTARTDASVTVQLAAARALAYLDQREPAIASFATIAATEAGDAGDRATAAAELSRLGDARGAPVLVTLAASPDPAVRRTVVMAHLAAGTITPGLWAALADDQPATRLDAATVLLTLGVK